MTVVARTLLATTLIAGGWLAQALSATDRDVDRGIEALEAGDYEAALEHFDAATERRGERPELEYDRGLALSALGRADDAAKAFERGTESEHATVRSSSHYQLGNAAFAKEDYAAAIAAYEACLRAMPEHQNAKWNLELALRKKQEQDEEQEKQDQENQDQENQDQENQDQENQDQENQDQENQDQENQDQENQDQENQDQENQDQENQDQENQDQQGDGEDDQEPEEPAESQPDPADGEQDEPEGEPGKSDPPPPAASPKAFDEADLDKALEQLDEEDRFMLGRPNAPRRPVEKDW